MSQTEVQLIKADAVQTADIANSAVTDAKISALTSSKLTGALPAISGASLTNLPAGGITEADTWRLNDSYGNTDQSTLIQDPIQNNLVRINQPINGYLGTGMTVSSGIWTFPSTGYWLVIAQVCMNGIASRESRYNGLTIMGTVNNSSYVDLSRGYTMFEDYSTSRFMSFTISTVCDITNVSTHKVKFKSTTLNDTRVIGDTDEEQTSFKFIKLADT